MVTWNVDGFEGVTYNNQEYGNIESTTGHCVLFAASLLSCSPYTVYTVKFQFTRHSLDLSDNVLYDWLFPHKIIIIN